MDGFNIGEMVDETMSLTSNPNQIMKEMTVNHPTMFVRRSVYEKLGTFRIDFRYAMDYELVLRLVMAGVQVVSLDRILAHMQYARIDKSKLEENIC